MRKCSSDEIRALALRYSPKGLKAEPQPFGSGHINDTYLFESSEGEKWILQRINKEVFHHPEEVMENMRRVTGHLKEAIRREGGDPDTQVLQLIETPEGDSFVLDDWGDCWRCTLCVPEAVSYDHAESLDVLRESGLGFGRFFTLLNDFDAGSLYETIVHFHDTPHRFSDFREAIRQNLSGRGDGVREDIDRALTWESFGSALTEGLACGDLPIRVTHNDTKLNNVLLNRSTGKAMCVIDLDTVMPGAAAYDFGDAIRTGASTADEDEKDLSRVGVSMERFTAYTEGFLQAAAPVLTEKEAASLITGAEMMTLENGIRFLGDYLNGDVYYKTAYPEHNLVRSRAQFRLLEELHAHREEMQATVDRLYRRYH